MSECELNLQDLIFDFEEAGPLTSTQAPHPPLTLEENYSNYLDEVLHDFPPIESISPLVENVSSDEDTGLQGGHSPGLYKDDPMVPVYGTFPTSLTTKSVVEF